MTNTTSKNLTPEPDRWAPLRRVVPVVWLALSAAWATVIVVTDQVTWPLALWIATTLGPLTAIDRRRRCDTTGDTNSAGP